MMDFSPPTPLAYFAALVQDDAQLPLLEAAAALAQDEHPALDVQQVLADVDSLAARLARRVPARADALERLSLLNRFYFGELGFAGNVNDYYLPANSYIHEVLRTRRGIPISLAVPWLELARGLGLQADGVGFPGHFLVQVTLPMGGKVVVDPFTGQSLGVDELRERLLDLHPSLPGAGQALDLRPYLHPASARQMLVRMLHNLQDLHRARRHWPRLVAVQDRLIVLRPTAWAEYRERGLALAELGDAQRARADLALYLREAGEAASDREAVQQRLMALGG